MSRRKCTIRKLTRGQLTALLQAATFAEEDHRTYSVIRQDTLSLNTLRAAIVKLREGLSHVTVNRKGRTAPKEDSHVKDTIQRKTQ
jgi:hypothetical protein